MSERTTFTNDTSYRTEYIKKDLEKCPAVYVDTDKSPFNYVTTDDATGHKYYAANNVTNPVYAQWINTYNKIINIK